MYCLIDTGIGIQDDTSSHIYFLNNIVYLAPVLE